MELPTLDAHAHLASNYSSKDLEPVGAVLAMTLSLDEAELVIHRQDPMIAWGIGCHPRFLHSQETFNSRLFADLSDKTAIIGEIGLDTGSHVPMDLQLTNFRQILEILSNTPHFVSIHSYRATNLVLQELRRFPITVPILHWWTGSASETSEAVEIGCFFSIHSAIARHSKFRTRVPLERILVESDHGYQDPPAAIPCRIQWVEYLVAQQYGIGVEEVRRCVWLNLTSIVEGTQTRELLPEVFGMTISLLERLRR